VVRDEIVECGVSLLADLALRFEFFHSGRQHRAPLPEGADGSSQSTTPMSPELPVVTVIRG
jgi:hypothetical protein